MDITLQDRVKRLYQRAFGGGHLISDPSAFLAHLVQECVALPPATWEEPLFEPIGNGLCRMHLRPLLRTGLSLETAAAMCVYSASHSVMEGYSFLPMLEALAETDADREWIAAYRADGMPLVGHSKAYRDAYRPAYRVVRMLFADAFELVRLMDAMPHGLIAIDGPCASGKSTLAAALGTVFGAGVLHMDDFFLRPEQRTKQRLAEPGGNVDRERFAAEVLTPLRAAHDFAYRPYDCSVQAVSAPVAFLMTPRVIVEGAYSMHPELRDAYALSAFVTVDPAEQRARLLERNGPEMLQRFEAEWIPMEQAYFEAFQVTDACDVHLSLQ